MPVVATLYTYEPWFDTAMPPIHKLPSGPLQIGIAPLDWSANEADVNVTDAPVVTRHNRSAALVVPVTHKLLSEPTQMFQAPVLDVSVVFVPTPAVVTFQTAPVAPASVTHKLLSGPAQMSYGVEPLSAYCVRAPVERLTFHTEPLP